MQRSKYMRQFCHTCRAETKMMLVGEMPSEVEGVATQKVWYRCSKCRQVLLFDLEAIGRQREEATKKIDPKDCTEYDPAKSYQVGEAIFHSEWSDMGKVMAKEKTSSGGEAIVVSFERLGERRLIENLKVVLTSPEPPLEQRLNPEIPNAPQSEVI
jgi:hypothetical protein